jgi:hypothetical protein
MHPSSLIPPSSTPPLSATSASTSSSLPAINRLATAPVSSSPLPHVGTGRLLRFSTRMNLIEDAFASANARGNMHTDEEGGVVFTKSSGARKPPRRSPSQELID